MKTKIYYSIRNSGDGSAYPFFMESLELAKIDQEYDYDTWAEDCSGWITIEHTGHINILDHIETAEEMRNEILEDLEYLSKDSHLHDKLKAVNKLLGVD